jgi:thiaminase/transcriptional activator TenA
MKLTSLLRGETKETWDASLRHPFVQAMGAGTLAEEKFRFYLAQDYVYLKDYCRFIAVGAAKSPTLASMTELSDLLQVTLKVEMGLHRSVCDDFGISSRDLEQTNSAPNCLGYTSYLLRTAYEGDFLDFLAAFLPCEWGYVEIGRTLKKRGLPPHVHYAKWIETYASQEFWDLTKAIKDQLDRLAEGAPPNKVDRLREIFRCCVRWEYLFWDMAWRMQTWAA